MTENPDFIATAYASMLGVLVYLTVVLLFLKSVKKTTEQLQTASSEPIVEPQWIWSQFIPLWNLVALVIYSKKMVIATEAFNKKYQSDLNFPMVWAWAAAFSVVYLWIPVIGATAAVMVFIMLWVNIVNVGYNAQWAKEEQTQSGDN